MYIMIKQLNFEREKLIGILINLIEARFHINNETSLNKNPTAFYYVGEVAPHFTLKTQYTNMAWEMLLNSYRALLYRRGRSTFHLKRQHAKMV